MPVATVSFGSGKIAPGKEKAIVADVVAGFGSSFTFCPAETLPIVPPATENILSVFSCTFLDTPLVTIGKIVESVGLTTSGK
jgi:hypothetical protein